MSWSTSAPKTSQAAGSACPVGSKRGSAREVDVENLVYKPIVKRAVREVLVDRNRSQRQPEKGQLTAFDAGRLFADAWCAYRERLPEHSLAMAGSSRTELKTTCLTVAFLDVLGSAGIERGYSIKLVTEIIQIVREKWEAFTGPAPQARSERPSHVEVHPEGHVSLPVSFNGAGGYRQVNSQEWDRRRRTGTGR